MIEIDDEEIAEVAFRKRERIKIVEDWINSHPLYITLFALALILGTIYILGFVESMLSRDGEPTEEEFSEADRLNQAFFMGIHHTYHRPM